MQSVLQILLHNKLWKTLVFAYVVLSFLMVLWCLDQMRQLKSENNRVTANFEAEVRALEEVETRAGQIAYQNGVYNLKLSELADLYPNLIDEIRNLKVKPRRAESILTTSYNSEKHIVTELRDSVIFDTVEVRSFAYNDQWYDITGYSDNKHQHVYIAMQDTLVQVVYKGERIKPWLWIFSPRKLEQRIALKNPNAKITYTQFIEILKEK